HRPAVSAQPPPAGRRSGAYRRGPRDICTSQGQPPEPLGIERNGSLNSMLMTGGCPGTALRGWSPRAVLTEPVPLVSVTLPAATVRGCCRGISASYKWLGAELLRRPVTAWERQSAARTPTARDASRTGTSTLPGNERAAR